MSRFEHSLPASYFDGLYAQDSDPWRFASSDYERDKYAATLAALPRARYRSALEVGCSIGALTQKLAARAQTLHAIDVAAKALDAARRRCADFDNVRFDLIAVPEQWPSGWFDLVMLSEVVYYLDQRDVTRLADRVRGSIEPGGDIVLVHWIGETHYPLSGDEAVALFASSIAGWAAPHSCARHEAYRLDVFRAGAGVTRPSQGDRPTLP